MQLLFLESDKTTVFLSILVLLRSLPEYSYLGKLSLCHDFDASVTCKIRDQSLHSFYNG